MTCGGIAAGFGWGSGFKNEDMMDFQEAFLSCGIDSAHDKETYQQRLDYMPNSEMFINGGKNLF